MKKLFTHLLAVAAAILLGSASTGAQEALAIDFGNISPAPYTLFVKGSANEYLHEIDIMFPEAQQITINPDVKPICGYVSLTNALNVKAHQAYYGDTPTVSAIDGGIRITVYGKGSYGSNELGLSYAVNTNPLALKLPAGLITVKGVDGVDRSNADTYLRYFWENFEAVHPVGITPGSNVSEAQLTTITFPADVTIGSAPTNYYGNKLKLFKIVGNEKPEEIASFTLSQQDGAPLKGALVMKNEGASIPAGQYFIAYTSNYIFKKNGVEQKGAYMFPINVVSLTATEMSVKIAEGFSATGKNLPEFALSVAGTPVFSAGAVTATIGEDVYNLTVSGQNLAFSAADAAAIKEQFANKDAFQVAIAAAAGAIQVSGDDSYSNSNAIAATFTLKIEDMMDFSQYEGLYYMKYLIGQSQDGDPVEIRGLKQAYLANFSDEGMGYMLTGFADPTPETSNGLVYGVPNAAKHSIDFPACQMLYFSDAPRAGLTEEDVAQVALIAKDEDTMIYDPATATKIPAYIHDDATITFDGWKLATISEQGGELKADYAYVTDGKSLFIPLSENKPEAASDFKVEFTSGASGLVVAASAVLPDKDVTGFEVYAGEDLVYKNYRVAGGEHLDFVLDLVPAKGTTYTFTAKVYNCLTESDPASVVLTFDPIDINDVIGDYKTEAFSGKMSPYAADNNKKVNVLVNDTQFSYVDMKMTVAQDGDAVGVEYPVVITGLGDFNMQGTFNALTGRFTFKQEGAYNFTFSYTDPDTGSEKSGSQTMDMIAYNKTDDIVKNTPAVADFAENKITFGGGVSPAWCLVYYGGMDLYNTTAISCTEMVLVKDVTVYTPGSPVLTLTDDPDKTAHHVSGTVTMPTADAEGNPLPASVELSVYVYRNLPIGPMEPLMNKVVAADNGPEIEGFTLVYAGEKAAPGEVVKFTDPATDLDAQQEFYYVATVAHNGTFCEEPDMKLIDSYSAISEIFTDADDTHNVYNIQGILLIRDANADAVRSLNSGIYVVGGRKVFVK